MNKPISSSLMFIPLEKLIPDNDPIRKNLSQEHIWDLKDSFSLFNGLGPLDPLLVMPVEGGNYLILNGNHRYMALKESQAAEAPCHVVEPASDAEIFLMKLHANTKRKNLTDLEACEALSREKAIYEAFFPETKRGQNKQGPNGHFVRTENPSFTMLQAKAQGVDPKTFRRDVKVGELVQEIPELKETGLTKSEALTLAERKPEEREVIKQALKTSTDRASTIRDALRKPVKQPEKPLAEALFWHWKEVVRLLKETGIDWNQAEMQHMLTDLDEQILPEYIRIIQRERASIQKTIAERQRLYS